MGYFSYFIKCIIRNFVNLIFKPKGLFIIFIIIFMLFLSFGTVRAEGWTDENILDLQADLFDIIFQLTQQVEDLESIKNYTFNIENGQKAIWDKLDLIQTEIQNLKSDTSEINSKLSIIVSDLSTLNNEILNIYNTLEENQQELLTELEKDNQAVLEELNMIRDSINGTDEELTNYIDFGIIPVSNNSPEWYLKRISIDFQPKYSYTIKIHYRNPFHASMVVKSFLSDNVIPSDFILSDYEENFKTIGKVPPSDSYVITYNIPTSNLENLYINWGEYILKIEVYRSIKGIVESLNQSNDLQQQQNQLQQQQNQLQQEQNDFLSKPSEDSDVSVDSFNNVDSNDITSSGLSGVFNSIYSSITSWNAKNISLPIPYTNKSIVIPANYTENMLNSSGGGWIITFIHAVYYFIVGRFMIYSITNIINSIKSGSILNTDSKNNITTDML